MENIDRAQTRTEQEQLAATVTEYSKKAIAPSLIDGLEVRREAVPSLATTRASLASLPVLLTQAGPEPVVGGEARAPLSSVAPLRTGEGRRLPESEPVFRSDEEFESAKARLDAKGISDVQVFGEAPKSYWDKQKEVKTERRPLMEPPKKFEDESGMKGIQVVGEMPEGYLKARRAEFERVVPEVGKKLSFEPESVTIRPGVNISNLRDDVYPGVEKVLQAYKAIDVKPEITSGFRTPETLKRKVDGKVKRSFHLLGRGVDFGWAALSSEQRESLKEQFDSLSKRGKTVSGNDIWTFDGFELIIHDEGFGEHVHLEHDTDKTQSELDAKMAELNKGL
jgi:hypothetical protein